jgi:hypothetical protein
MISWIEVDNPIKTVPRIRTIKLDRAIGLKENPVLFDVPGPRPSSPAVA